jgi:hypothetical protein
MEEEYISVLRHEFSAEEGSFLLQLRIRSRWDKSAFDRLTEAMLQCCKHYMPDHSTQETSLPVQAMLFPISESLQKQYVQAQKALMQHIQAEEMLLPRWLAEGFWYVSTFVPDHTSHPAWQEQRTREQAYFDKANRRLEGLAFWFFTGQPPWEDVEKGWASTFMY